MKTLKILSLAILLLLVAACRSTSGVEKKDADASSASAEANTQKVMATRSSSPALTAKLKLDVNLGKRSLSAGGHLRMKRDDVVQLSVTFLGMEVGRMEFTQEEVLIIDRFNKQFVRAKYADVSFLRDAGLDFYAVQALFWNELFAPGEKDAADALKRFRVVPSRQQTTLVLTDAPRLNYAFVTETSSGKIDAIAAERKDVGKKDSFSCEYADFKPFAEKPFPTAMTFSLLASGKAVGLTLSLSRLSDSGDWATRTNVSSKYKERRAEDILRQLLSF